MIRTFDAATYFLLDGDGVRLQDFCGPFSDEYYIEGWIELNIGTIRLLGREQCDLVDQLWAYLIDGTTQLLRGHSRWETYFPDQPLRLALQLEGAKKLVFTVGEEQSTVKFSAFRNAVSLGGIQFFERMNELLPKSSDVWSGYIEKSSSLVSENAR